MLTNSPLSSPEQYGNRSRYPMNSEQSQNQMIPLQQSHSAPSTLGVDFEATLGGLVHERLDDFQLQLFQFLHNASDATVNNYYQKNVSQFQRFIISLYIVSLNKTHPARHGNNALDLYNEFQNELSSSSQTRNPSTSISASSSYSRNVGHVYSQSTTSSTNFGSNTHLNQEARHRAASSNQQMTRSRDPNTQLSSISSTPYNDDNNITHINNNSNSSNNSNRSKNIYNDSIYKFPTSSQSVPTPTKTSRNSNNNSPQQSSPQPQTQQPPPVHNTGGGSPFMTPNTNISFNSIVQSRKETKSKPPANPAPKYSINKKRASMKSGSRTRRRSMLAEISEEEEKNEKLLLVEQAEIIAPMTKVHGKIRVTNKSIAFIPDKKQPETIKNAVNLAIHPPNLEVMECISSLRADKHFPATSAIDKVYYVAVNVASSYEQIGGTRYKLMNAKNVWSIDQITEIYYRRYQARNCAFELFFNDDTSWLFNLFSTNKRNAIFDSIMNSKPRNLIDDPQIFKNPKKAIKSSKIHHKWCTRGISNFEYIMRINLLAGRTFNDLEQYPVVPWILKDYESDKIDLKNPKIYRDLRKPVGALNPDRLNKFVERYDLMADDPSNRFMYGTHYSTKAIVLYYLIRMEPFTSYNKLFQGGKFDTADRLFDSITKCFAGCMKSTSDVKELIPEFFFMTDFLQNKQNLDLGTTQSGQKINHVLLPKWANGSTTTFVKTMRNAFESEYVSRNLHHWIDLIFGYKQIGKQAELAHNVFHPYTYQDNVDLDKINNAKEKEVILEIISEFGQTPMQIFKKAHRERLKGTQIVHNIFRAKSIKYYGKFLCTETADNNIGISYICIKDKNVISVSTDNTVSVHKFHSKTFTITKKAQHSSLKVLNSLNRNNKKSKPKYHANDANVRNQIIKKQSAHILLKNLCFAVTENGAYLFASGFEDNSFLLYNIAQERVEEEYHEHTSIVSCLALDEDSRKNKLVLVSGSYDKSIIVWKGRQNNKQKHNRSISANYYKSKDQSSLELSLMYTKNKHDAEINCVDISIEKGVIIVGTKLGSMYMYNSSNGNTLWHKTIQNEQTNQSYNIAMCCVSKTFGTVLCYCYNYDKNNNAAKLYLYSNSGELLNECVIPHNDKYHEIKFSKSGNNACCGGLNKKIVIYNLPSFNIGRELTNSNQVITTVGADKDEKVIFAGLSNGNVLLYSFPLSAQKATPKLPHRNSLYGVAGNKHKGNPFQLQ